MVGVETGRAWRLRVFIPAHDLALQVRMTAVYRNLTLGSKQAHHVEMRNVNMGRHRMDQHRRLIVMNDVSLKSL